MDLLRRRSTLLVVAVGVLLALRLPFRAPTLDDLDSANFYAGVLDYDPTGHRPHPPGFPVFIFAAKCLSRLTDSPVAALTLQSALAGSLAVVPLYAIASRLFGPGTGVVASTFVLFTPIVWFAGVRPMSDASGLLAALTAQALMLGGLDPGQRRADLKWLLGAAAAGLAIGVRLQVCVLVIPVFLFGWLVRRRQLALSPVVLGGAILVWLVPMIWISGGWHAYAAAFNAVMSEAASWEPFLSRPSADRALDGLWYVFAAPWITGALAVPLLAAAALGLVRACVSNRRACGVLLLLYLPYAIFHFLVQNLPAIRYAIPVVPMVALLAARGLATMRFGWWSRLVPVGAYVGIAAATSVPALAEYRRPGPVFQAMEAASLDAGDTGALTGASIFLRYMAFAPPNLRVFSPEGGEGWPRATEYWKRGRTGPLYFLNAWDDGIARLVSPESRRELGEWAWSPRVMPFMSGERPNRVRVARLDPPVWFLRRARYNADRGGTLGLFARGKRGSRHVLLQGESSLAAEQVFVLDADGVPCDRQQARGKFTLQAVVDSDRYVELGLQGRGVITVTNVLAPAPHETLFLPLSGFYRDVAPGNRVLRWMAPTAVLLVHVPAQGAVLRLEGQVPAQPDLAGLSLRIGWNGATAASIDLTEPTFAVDVPLPGPLRPWSELRLEASHHFVPDEVTRNGDRRALAFQVTSIALHADAGGFPLVPAE